VSKFTRYIRRNVAAVRSMQPEARQKLMYIAFTLTAFGAVVDITLGMACDSGPKSDEKLVNG
jgi:hypothetical protein